MEKYYLAVDIGASSGRHILGRLENGKIELEEIYRFENGMDHKDGKLLWDVNRLFGEIVAGMKKCKELGKLPVSMAIDTWAVDYVLLDEKIRFWEILTATEITVLTEWMRKWRKYCRRRNCMPEPVFRSRFLIRFISLWQWKRRPRRL